MPITKGDITRGNQFESKWRDWVRKRGHQIERLRQTGTKDEGDCVIHYDGLIFLGEAKSPRGLSGVNLLEYVRQAELEAERFVQRRQHVRKEDVIPYVVVEDVKARKGAGEALVVLRARDFLAATQAAEAGEAEGVQGEVDVG